MELSYLLITPYSLRKSRTGGILSRTLSRSGLELVGARMFAPSRGLVQFMTGTRPSQCALEKCREPGSAKCVALLYRGVDAVSKIREVLGPTVPAKAPFGTIRSEFGETMMVNAAHASDSVENAKREMDIIRMAENNLSPLLHAYLS
jgi:nucleoside diphosphate kinase